jgi:ABC-type Fe3+ transport system permease subunit
VEPGPRRGAWILFLIILVIGVINLFITRNLVRDEGSRNTLTRRRCARARSPAAVAADRAAASSPPHRSISGGDAMSVLNEPSRRRRRATRPAEEGRPRHVKGTRPGWFVYACLAVVLVGSLFPFYWSLLIGSGDSYTIRDPNMSWIPGGNFFANAAKVVNDPAVNFWVALWNSIVSSGLIALRRLLLHARRVGVRQAAFKGRAGWSSSSRRWPCRPSWASCRCTSCSATSAGPVSSARSSCPRS